MSLLLSRTIDADDRRQVIRAGFVVAIIGLATGVSEGAEASLQQIRDALREQFSSILSLDVKFSYAFETTKPELTASTERDYEWCIDGNKRATFCNVPGEPSEQWSIKAFDGEWSQSASLTSLEPRQVKFLNRFKGEHPLVLKEPIYALAVGFAFMNEPGNLASLLDDPTVELVGHETTGGHDCIKIESGKVLSRAGGAVYRYTLWLDPVVSWLPRRLIWHLDPTSPNYEAVTSQGKYAELSDYQLLEYGWFPDAVLGRDRPLPIKFTEKNEMGHSRVELKSLTANQPIDPQRFTVRPTFGTKVVEGEYPKDPNARRWLHGGVAAEAQDRQRRIERARELSEKAKQEIAAALAVPPEASRVVDATPRKSGALLWWLVGGGSAFVLGFAMWRWATWQ